MYAFAQTRADNVNITKVKSHYKKTKAVLHLDSHFINRWEYVIRYLMYL